MLVSQKLGSLPILSAIWDHGPVVAALIMLAVDFGMISLLMCVEGVPPWRRPRLYRTFLWGDFFFIPLGIAMTVVVLEAMPVSGGSYIGRSLHPVLLVAGFGISLGMEIGAVRAGQYTLKQELSPSKLWHTFIVGVIIYWFASAVIPVFSELRPLWATLGIAVALGGFIGTNVIDHHAGLTFDRMHLEGSYFPWKWRRRIR